jgi:hypothetical protein
LSIEETILDEEYDLTLRILKKRSEAKDFDINLIEQELKHIEIFEGQDWAGRGEIKNSEIRGQIYAYLAFIRRYKDHTDLLQGCVADQKLENI